MTVVEGKIAAKKNELQIENKSRNKSKYINNNNKCEWILKVYYLEI